MTNFIDGVKQIFRKEDKHFYAALYHILGFYPHNIEYYRIAFAHKSQQYRSDKEAKPLNNERLEFLGDAVLETIVSDIIFRRFPNKREGFLTNTRSKIVQRETLGRLATDLGIEALVKSRTKSQAHNSYIGGNAFEALVGAIYLDRGFKAAFWFIEHRIIDRAINVENVANKEVNFKSKLLEWSQKNRIRTDFKPVEEKRAGTSDAPTFHTVIDIEGIRAGEGKGFSKKESHQNAAKDALTRMRRDAAFLDAIFRSKEKRTAMEAEEYFVLPPIAEIDDAIAKEEKAKKGGGADKEGGSSRRRGRDKNSRPERAAKAQRETATPKTAEEAAATPKAEEKAPAKTRQRQPRAMRQERIKAAQDLQVETTEQGQQVTEQGQQMPAPAQTTSDAAAESKPRQRSSRSRSGRRGGSRREATPTTPAAVSEVVPTAQEPAPAPKEPTPAQQEVKPASKESMPAQQEPASAPKESAQEAAAVQERRVPKFATLASMKAEAAPDAPKREGEAEAE